MNVQPNVEELEERAVPSATASGGFQQQPFAAMPPQLQAGVQALQSILQTDVNQLAALAPTIPAAFQPVFNAALLQEQQVINLLPVLADIEFDQALMGFESQALGQNSFAAFPGGFFPFGFFPGFFGFPGLGFGGLGFGGLGSSGLGAGGFPGGFGSSISSFGSSPSSSGFAPFGQVAGGGLMMPTGALTLPASGRF